MLGGLRWSVGTPNASLYTQEKPLHLFDRSHYCRPRGEGHWPVRSLCRSSRPRGRAVGGCLARRGDQRERSRPGVEYLPGVDRFRGRASGHRGFEPRWIRLRRHRHRSIPKRLCLYRFSSAVDRPIRCRIGHCVADRRRRWRRPIGFAGVGWWWWLRDWVHHGVAWSGVRHHRWGRWSPPVRRRSRTTQPSIWPLWIFFRWWRDGQRRRELRLHVRIGWRAFGDSRCGRD